MASCPNTRHSSLNSYLACGCENLSSENTGFILFKAIGITYMKS